jgi:hypothetical protein
MAKYKSRVSISPRTIEAVAIASFVVVVIVGAWALAVIPKQRSGDTIPVTTDYYGELLSVAERWKVRKQAEQLVEAKAQEKRRIADRL